MDDQLFIPFFTHICSDGQILVFDPEGKRTITVPERPSMLRFGGKDRKTLFIAARSKLFGIPLE